MTRQIKKLSESKITTATGGLTLLAGLLLPLIPSDVRSGCLDVVANSENPLFVGALIIAGIGLTSIGPSLANRKRP